MHFGREMRLAGRRRCVCHLGDQNRRSRAQPIRRQQNSSAWSRDSYKRGNPGCGIAHRGASHASPPIASHEAPPARRRRHALNQRTQVNATPTPARPAAYKGPRIENSTPPATAKTPGPPRAGRSPPGRVYRASWDGASATLTEGRDTRSTSFSTPSSSMTRRHTRAADSGG